MKKALILFSAAALALVSCAKVQDVYAPESHEIAFQALATPATRVAADTYQYAISNAVFPTDLNMYVAAYQVEPTPKNYFEGTQFTYSGSNWGGATPRYWPLYAAYINFLAYANVTGTATFAAAGDGYASGAVITQTDNSSAQTDLMYAIGNGTVSNSGNTWTIPTDVDMTFIHAQAWIDFTVKAANTAAEAITVNSVTLNGANYSGIYTITHANFDSKTSQSVSGAWTSPGSNKDVVVPDWSAAALDEDTAVTVGKGLMIVPGASAFTSFTVNYTLNGEDFDYTYTPTSTTVAQATHYTYALTFTLQEIRVDAAVAPWTNGGSTPVAIP